jgi:hypothetical protein
MAKVKDGKAGAFRRGVNYDMDKAPKAFREQQGKGRPKGSVNKVTAQVKDMVITALSKAGGVDYLVSQAGENPAAFMTLVGKVIPLQVAGDASMVSGFDSDHSPSA